MSANSVDSPCVRSCCLDQHDICIGCGRNLDEIKNWQRASNASRQEILVLAAARLEQRRQALQQLKQLKR